MFDQTLAQLQSPDVKLRREAIIELGKHGNMSVLPALANVFRSDPEPSLRELARRAGLAIRARGESASPPVAGPAMPPAPAPSSAPTPRDTQDLFALYARTSPTPPAEPDMPPAPPPAETLPSSARTVPAERPASPVNLPPQRTAPQHPVQPDPDEFEFPEEIEKLAASAFTVPLDEVPEDQLAPYRASRNEPEGEPDLDALLGIATATAGLAGASKRGIQALEKPSAPRTAADDIEDELKGRVPVTGRTYNVPHEARERAKMAMESALSAHMRGDNARGLKLLTEALSLDPNLINSTYFGSIAGSVTGLDSRAAIQVIVDKSQRTTFVRSAETELRQKRISQHLGEASKNDWGAAGFELVLYILIATFGPFFFSLVLQQSLQGTFGGTEFLSTVSDDMQLSSGFNLPALLLACLIAGFGSLVGLFIQTGIIHLVSVTVLRGAGTFSNVLTLILRVYNRWLPVIWILAYVLVAMIFFSQGSAVVLCVALPIVILSIYMLFQVVVRIGQAYAFGAAMGCVALLLSGIVLMMISTLIGVLTGQSVGTALYFALGLS